MSLSDRYDAPFRPEDREPPVAVIVCRKCASGKTILQGANVVTCTSCDATFTLSGNALPTYGA